MTVPESLAVVMSNVPTQGFYQRNTRFSKLKLFFHAFYYNKYSACSVSADIIVLCIGVVS